MALSENQLSTWSNQGSTVNPVNTYEIIKNNIDRADWNNDVNGNYKYREFNKWDRK